MNKALLAACQPRFIDIKEMSRSIGSSGLKHAPTPYPTRTLAATTCSFSTTYASDGSQGSSYENYSETAGTYDVYRRTIGVDLMLDALAASARARGLAASDLRLLDAGCGSGNYLAALRPHVRSACGLEFNEAMLRTARCATIPRTAEFA